MKIFIYVMFVIMFSSFTHNRVKLAHEDKNLKISFFYQENFESAYLFIRKLGVRKYNKLKMSKFKNKFEVGISPQYIKRPGFEYFILTKNNNKLISIYGNKWEPQTVKVLKINEEKLTESEKEKKIFVSESINKKSIKSTSNLNNKISESPFVMTVITAKDIENMAVTSIADIFKTIPAMSVMRISATDSNVSIRGLNKEGSNRILTLVDGRIIYNDFLGFNVWSALSINVEDIERIEVIRGPAASIYGKDAFNGVISIYTKNSRKDKDNGIISNIGPYGINETLYSMGNENMYSYRISSSFNRNMSLENINDVYSKKVSANGSFHINYEDNSKLSFYTGFLKANLDSIFSLLGTFDIKEYSNIYFNTVYNTKHLRISFNYDWTNLETYYGLKNPQFIINKDNSSYLKYQYDSLNIKSFNKSLVQNNAHKIESEINYFSNIKNIDKFSLGLKYKYLLLNSIGLLDNTFSEHEISLFANNSLRISKLILNTSLRFDIFDTKDDMSGKEIDNIYSLSFRINLIYLINNSNNIKLSFSNAFRKPSYFESNMEINMIPKTIDSSGGVVDKGINYIANKNLKTEKIKSFELAYSSSFLDDKFKFNMAFFFNMLQDMILLKGDFTSILEVLTSSASIPNRNNLFRFNNNIDANSFGGELEISWYYNRYLSLFLNYSYQKLKITNKEEIKKLYSISDIHDLTSLDRENPEHIFNLGANISISDFYINLFFTYTASSIRNNFITELNASKKIIVNSKEIDVERNTFSYNKIDHHFNLNLNIKYKMLNDRLILGIVGENLLYFYKDFSKKISNMNENIENIGYNGSLANVKEISNHRHIEYPRTYFFGNVVGGETLGAKVNAYLKLIF